MIAQITISGVNVYFGEPFAKEKPEPFYPYLLRVEPIQDTTGEESGSASFVLHPLAKRLLGLWLRLPAAILDDELKPQFEGTISRIMYNEAINVTVEA